MQACESRSLSELVTELQTSAEEVASLAKNSESDKEVFTEFAALLEKFTPVLIELKENCKVMDRPPVRKAVESLEKELRGAKELIKSTGSRSPIKQMEYMTQDLGRSLGLVLFARFVSELDSEREIEEETVTLSIEDVVLQLKYGNDEEFRLALWGLRDFIKDHSIDNEWINNEGVIPILFNRLGSSKPHNRLTIIQMLRILASVNTENKEKMADVESLSLLVKSLTRDVDERGKL
ncbi:hypothetical protein GH714_016937 [Hevea brasiliensis]|uniref:Uncharacterized protein n=1 Tax=Hevea brasiliensis TaxID=3981 RepID=A0A6A6NAV2_HEVBR|nr:hypothetical protein GH714_016937 [Hevea brasiliensis]